MDFGESQQQASRGENEVQTTAPPTRTLEGYEKKFKPSTKIANQHDVLYEEPNDIINEHSQQQLTVKEGDFIPFFNNENDAPDTATGGTWETSYTKRPLIPYVDIQRKKNQKLQEA